MPGYVLGKDFVCGVCEHVIQKDVDSENPPSRVNKYCYNCGEKLFLEVKKMTAKDALEYLVNNMDKEELRTFLEAISIMTDDLGRRIIKKAAEP